MFYGGGVINKQEVSRYSPFLKRGDFGLIEFGLSHYDFPDGCYGKHDIIIYNKFLFKSHFEAYNKARWLVIFSFYASKHPSFRTDNFELDFHLKKLELVNMGFPSYILDLDVDEGFVY